MWQTPLKMALPLEVHPIRMTEKRPSGRFFWCAQHGRTPAGAVWSQLPMLPALIRTPQSANPQVDQARQTSGESFQGTGGALG